MAARGVTSALTLTNPTLVPSGDQANASSTALGGQPLKEALSVHDPMTDQRRAVVGVMGGGTVPDEVETLAEALGEAIAEAGWVLLNGGRAVGVMDASARGATKAGGLTIGILPDRGHGRGQTSEHVQVPIYTGLGDARNAVNVLSSDVVVALPGGPGTLSEVALALKARKHVVLVAWEESKLLERMGGDRLHPVDDVEGALSEIEGILG